MLTTLKTSLLILSFLSGLAGLAQTEVQVVTEDAPLRVVLVWSPDDTAAGYNVYRKPANALLWPRRPLNATPISLAEDCISMQQQLVKGSDTWDLLAQALATEAGLFYPCDLIDSTLSDQQAAGLSILARANWQIAAALGFGFEDDQVTYGQHYLYEIRAVDDRGLETDVLATGLGVTAGQPEALPAATQMAAASGDSRVLLTWESSPGATGYVVYRRAQGNPVWQRVNASTFLMRITTDLDHNPIDSAGYLDEMAWQENGDPGAHEVEGVNIVGPYNAVTYEYRVAAVDLLGQESTLLSETVLAQPLDTTAPQTPSQVAVAALEGAGINGGLEIRWTQVTRDIQGHPENLQAYEVSRYENANGPGVLVATVAPPAVGVTQVTVADLDPGLRSAYGPKTWFYRIQAVDQQGNTSAFSAAAGGFLKDIKAPAPPKNLRSEGFDAHIRISWNLGSEPDLDGYQLYRALCDDGEWNGEDRSSSPWVLIGELSFAEAEILAAHDGAVWMDDTTIPEGSPLCYAYLVKAKDTSQNTSGSWPPDFSIESYVCQNLRDRTGPDPAVVTALDARDESIRVSWAAPPIQDVKAYHVYRSEQVDTGYVWVGGRMVTEPADPPIFLEKPFTGDFSGCEEIPVTSQPYMGRGMILDKTADPKQIYHYKVLGVDVHGNESDLDDAIPASSFTYRSEGPSVPQISGIDQDPATCALTISWTPAFDGAEHTGFVVFREEVGGQGYLQVGSMISGNALVDHGVAPGKEYNYRVMLLHADGKTSAPSVPATHLVSE